MTSGQAKRSRAHRSRARSIGSIASRRLGFALLAVIAIVPTVADPARAQIFQWPWSESPKPPPTPREPVYRAPPVPAPAPAPAPAPVAPAPATNWSQNRPAICTQLEQRLAQEGQRGNPREQLPRIEADIRQADKGLRTAQTQLEKSDCYDYFLFSKSLRRSPTCNKLSAEVDAAKRQISDLEAQRQQIMGSGGRSYQDDIIRELARNNCGPGYVHEAKKREGGGSVWQDEEAAPGGIGGGFGSLPYATYRTVCVRLCDGYYFPISFSTTPSHFQRDSEVCQTKCAAPVELYFYQNPGGAVDQMTAFKSQEPYTRLKTAFRYRKELVQGCSCKTTEFIPQSGAPADRRADAVPPAPAAAPAKPR